MQASRIVPSVDKTPRNLCSAARGGMSDLQMLSAPVTFSGRSDVFRWLVEWPEHWVNGVW